jgi:carbonic anhydrase/acetyltransferase-like protein (isoleucine patch superfamily)
VGPDTLIGMGAILLDGVTVGENCLIAAGALLTGGQTFPPGSLILGQPARVVRALTEEEISRNRQTAARYVERARQYREAGDGRRET